MDIYIHVWVRFSSFYLLKYSSKTYDNDSNDNNDDIIDGGCGGAAGGSGGGNINIYYNMCSNIFLLQLHKFQMCE